MTICDICKNQIGDTNYLEVISYPRESRRIVSTVCSRCFHETEIEIRRLISTKAEEFKKAAQEQMNKEIEEIKKCYPAVD